jgi:hypothetical protein
MDTVRTHASAHMRTHVRTRTRTHAHTCTHAHTRLRSIPMVENGRRIFRKASGYNALCSFQNVFCRIMMFFCHKMDTVRTHAQAHHAHTRTHTYTHTCAQAHTCRRTHGRTHAHAHARTCARARHRVPGYFRPGTMEPIFSVVVWFLPSTTRLLLKSWEIIDTYLVLNNR